MNASDFHAEARPGAAGPLAGLRVVEVASYGAGPICSMVLSDLGAEAIKVELPGGGDPIRSWPPYLTGSDNSDRWSGIWGLTYNRGKRSVTLDIRKPEGQRLLRRLAAEADVLVENFTPGTMARWGLGYADLRQECPRLVYVSVSGFGQFGPLSGKRCLDPIAQAMGGAMAATGERGGRPLRVGFAIADNSGGWLGALGALAALRYRARTGRGQWVDAALVEAMLMQTDVKLMGIRHAGMQVERTGNGIDLGAPLDTFACADDRHLFVHALYDPHWRRLCAVLERQDLVDDERTRDWDARARNRDFVNGVVAEWTARHPLERAEAQLSRGGVTCGPVMNFDEVLACAHYRERASVIDLEHPRHGRVSTFGTPVKFSRTPAGPHAAAPALGADNDTVYGDLLGLDADERARLAADGVI